MWRNLDSGSLETVRAGDAQLCGERVSEHKEGLHKQVGDFSYDQHLGPHPPEVSKTPYSILTLHRLPVQ